MDAQVDALLFQARENGVSYGIIEERIEVPSFNSRFGARAKLTTPIGHDCWELAVQFLHYHSRAAQRKGVCGLPSWGHGVWFSQASDLWRLHLGVGDLFISESWSVSSCLTILPFWGLTYAMIRHKLLIDYGDVDLSLKDKFWGIGPLFGVSLYGELGMGFSLYGTFAIRLLYGEVYLHQDEGALIRFYDRYDKLQSLIETRIGLRWGYPCLYAQIGFEIHLFPRINQLVRFCDLEMAGKVYGNQGDLSLHGLSASLGIEF